jgi:hypothetical protein
MGRSVRAVAACDDVFVGVNDAVLVTITIMISVLDAGIFALKMNSFRGFCCSRLHFAGFVDMFDAEWCSWTGGAPHFSFMNQMDAGFANFAVFTRNLVPLLDEHGVQQLKAITTSFPVAAKLQYRHAMAAKLGVPPTHASFDTLLQQCESKHIC